MQLKRFYGRICYYKDYDVNTLRAYQKSVDEMKSGARDKAEKIL